MLSGVDDTSDGSVFKTHRDAGDPSNTLWFHVRLVLKILKFDRSFLSGVPAATTRLLWFGCPRIGIEVEFNGVDTTV